MDKPEINNRLLALGWALDMHRDNVNTPLEQIMKSAEAFKEFLEPPVNTIKTEGDNIERIH